MSLDTKMCPARTSRYIDLQSCSTIPSLFRADSTKAVASSILFYKITLASLFLPAFRRLHPRLSTTSLVVRDLKMLSRSITTAARLVPMRQLRPRNHHLVMLPAMMQTVRTYADSIVKVPQMAESISEGTLKQFSKSIGDYVEQDEEIATIETDKVQIATTMPHVLVLTDHPV